MLVRRKYIRSLVERLLARHHVTSAPVRVDILAEELGVRVQSSPADDSLSGFLLRDRNNQQAVIGVNSRHHDNRQRFTIAHELAHFLLHEGDKVHVDKNDRWLRISLRDDDSSAGSNAEEIEANTFAAELLMPEPFLRADLADHERLDCLDESTLDGVLKSMAKRYGVSTQALVYRLVNLGLLQL
jgi:Zn-dependent peptidase ImmA (M78 family)